MGKRKQKRQHNPKAERQKASPGEVDKTVAAKSENKKTALFLSLVLAFAVIVFSNSLSNGFTNWDDDHNVYENLYIRDITTKNIAVYFTRPLLAMYTPLVYLSYAIDYKIGYLNPAVYHATNLLLHLINIIFVFFVIRLLTERVEIAAIVTLFFSIHPMNVGAVAPVSVRSSLLYSMFYLGAYISYVAYLKNDYRQKYIVLSFILFALSVLSKSAAVVLPLLLVLTDWYYRRRFGAKTIIEKIPFVIISIVFSILLIVFREDVGHIESTYTFAVYERVFLVSYALAFYIVKLFIPVNLSAYYPYPEKASGILPWVYYITPFILAATVFAITKAQRYRRELVFGSLFFMIHIVLVLKIVTMGGEIVADRYVYLPYIGLLMILGCWYSGLPPVNRKKLYVAVSCLICVLFFSVLSHQQTLIWKNSLTLFDDVIKKYPRVALAYNNRGMAKRLLGDYEGALKDYDTAIALNPLYPKAYNNRGVTKRFLGNYEGALKDYDTAIALNPLYQEAYSNKGAAKTELGDYQAAIDDFTKAIELSPGIGAIWFNRGIAKFSLSDYANACSDWQKAFQLGISQAQERIRQHCGKITPK